MVKSIRQPCMDCERRHTACWSDCEDYARYKEEYAAMKKTISPTVLDQYLIHKMATRKAARWK